ncbi:MAG: M14 family metallocarboxypeptidase [Acidobacteria bacterium]|nr:M14 family metallocarboxypeptidase [Acidobacteriota bacterium]
MAATAPYPIGTQGVAWGDTEVSAWLARQTRQRSYEADVVARIQPLRPRLEILPYGELDYSPDRYSLFALKSLAWREELPCALVTGGVHGYETSGVLGALEFAERWAVDYAGRVNLLIVPCVSPWAYERIHRWNPRAQDPNRNFREPSPVPESAALMRLVAPWRDRFLLHIDLHETTDSDESEFSPALAARDGLVFEPGVVPDGFYLVDDWEHPQPAFQAAIIEAVAKVTPIAPPDARGEIIGSPVVAPGVIRYDFKGLGLCAGITRAPFKTTTEVYPDSPRASAEQCNAAQVAAVRAAIEYALAHADPTGAGR